jgi:hypothetical protein
VISRELRKKSDRQRSYFRRIRDEIIHLLGGKCAYCGTRLALQVDHIRGGGSRMRRRLTGATYQRAILRSVKRGSRAYQLLCPTHQWVKRHLNQEHRRATR